MVAKIQVRRGDTVQVISGDDAGARGRVLSVDPRRRRLTVERVNIVVRHTRRSRNVPQGGRIEKEAPIDASNVMLVCPHCDRPVRFTRKLNDDGVKVRICKKCGKEIERPQVD